MDTCGENLLNRVRREGGKKRFFVLTADGKFSQSKSSKSSAKQEKQKLNNTSASFRASRSHMNTLNSIQQTATPNNLNNVSMSMNSMSNSNLISSSMFLQQRTKIYTSEFRDHCFEICTPAQKKIILAAGSEQEKHDWIQNLKTACRNCPPRTIKICLVGKEKELQQQFLHSFFKECGQTKLAEDVLNYSYKADNVELTLNLEVTQEKVKLVLCCVSEADYPKLRVLNYVDANAFMMCYASQNMTQFDEIETVWFPEVQGSVQKGASLFLIGLREKQDSNQEESIDRVVGEEFAQFLGASFFDVDMHFNPPGNENNDVDSSAGDGRDPSEIGDEYDSPAETFLDVLQATIEDADGSIIDDTVASDDVAKLTDFDTSFFSINPLKRMKARMSKNMKPMNFVQFVKAKTSTFSTFIDRVRTRRGQSMSSTNLTRMDTSTNASEGNNLDAETVGTLRKLKEMLKKLKPKKRKRPKLPKIGAEEKEKAHYVSRHETGSLIFLGDSYLDEESEAGINP